LKTGEEIGKATYRDLRHPRRNPLMTALTASGFVSAGAGTAARGAAAAGALKTGGLKAAAKAAAKRPLPGVRTHIYEGQPIRGRYSPAASSRAVQKARDKATGGKIGVRKAERLLSEERRVTDAAAKAPALKALAASKGVTDPENAAIRVVAEGIPLDDVIEAHLRRAKQIEETRKNRRRGGVPGGGTTLQNAMRFDKRHRALLKKAAILEEARKYLDVGEDGRPILSAAHPKLAGKYAAGEKAAQTREARLKATGLLTREQAESRVQAPGRAMVKTVSGGRAIKTERPRTVEEAQARVDSLEAQLDKSITSLAKSREPDFMASGGGKGKSAREWEPGIGRRGAIGGQPGRYLDRPMQMPAGPRRTAKENARRWAEQKIIDEGSKPGAHPVYTKLVAMMDELAELKGGLNPMIFEKADPSKLGTISEFKLFEDVEPFQGGRFRVPDVLRSKRLPHGPAAYRGGVPRQPGTLTHGYTGALRQSGKYTSQSLKAIAEDALEAERYLSVERFRQDVLPFGQKARPLDTRRAKYAPARTRDLKKGEAQQLRKTLEDVELENLTPDEAARVEMAVQAWERNLFPEEGKDIPIARPGEVVPGVVWIDKRLLGSQRKLIGSLGPVDVAQDAVKGLILYAKPGYVTPNVLGNIGYNLMQQGIFAPRNWARAVKMPKDLGFMVDEVMGAGFARGLAEGTTSPISGVVRKAGNFWSKFVDGPFRKAAFVHEARLRGFKTDADLRSLIEDSGHRADLGEIGQRARDAIIDYERLGPIERDIIRRVLFVYPWIKGSTYYAAQFLRDHPIQAAVFAKIGEEGTSQSLEELGPLPSWARGSFKVGGSQERPSIVNPAAISPFSTPAQVLAAARGSTGGVERSENIGEMASPVAQSLIEAAFGRDLFSGRELEGGYLEKFGKQLGKGLPQYQLYKRGGFNFIPGVDQHIDPDKAYPYSPNDARGAFLLGSSFPRPANRAVLNEQAQGPRPSGLEKTQAEQKAVLPKLRGKVDPEDFKHIQRAYVIRSGMETIREKTRDETEEGEPYYRAVLEAEARYMGELGFAEKADVDFLVRIARKGTYDEVRKRRNALVQGAYESLYLLPTRSARKLVGYEAP